MIESIELAEAAVRGNKARIAALQKRSLVVFQAVALGAALAVVVLTWQSARWDPWWLAIITALTVASDITYVELQSGKLKVSGSFLGMMLAAVLLGGGPAALVGVITISVGWFRSREAGHYFRNNLVTFAWFPLLSGLGFHAITHLARVGPHAPSFYLLVLAAFMFALALDFAMIAGYQCLIDGTSPRQKLDEIAPILAPELFSAVLTLIAVYVATQLGIVGLALFALVLILFQYLVGELLTSQRRGAELRQVATTDELTGLANRKSFGERLDAEIEACRERGESFGVLLLDLDRFKEINDTLGHQYGDQLLKELGPRLAERVGGGGMVARLGGDEFAVLTGTRNPSEVDLGRSASELITCVNEPIVIEDISLEIAGSVGIARYPIDGGDAQTLLRRADIAMYDAKEHRDGYRLYDAEHDHHSTQRLGVLGEFRQALLAGEIVVHYQPIVDLRSLRVRGAEGLVRWEHPELGLLQPATFLAIVEQTGLIGALTRTVLDDAIAQCAAWRRDGLDLTVAVNLSVRNLLDSGLPADIERMLRRHRLSPDALQLEITESMIMSDPERALSTVKELSELGVRLAVDDFGTGHSSLANLRRLPIDELKIDRSFVTPMLEDESDLIIVRSTINLGHDLGLTIIAEGVEDAGTLDRLDLLGCDLAQGNHLSEPMPPDEFAGWVDDFYAAANVS